MIFAVDAGNTSIVIGCIEKGKVLFTEYIAANQSKTSLEYAIDFKLILDFHSIDPESVEGGIISSVVLPLSNVIKLAVEKICRREPLVVGPGIKTGLAIRIDNPAQLGSDLVVGAVAAIAEYPVPSIVIDMGTATTFSVISDKKYFLGGAIVPGTLMALDALSAQTSQLPHISLDAPKQTICTNTIDCMKSGSVYGSAALIDGMIERISSELGQTPSVIATGGISRYIVPYCRHNIIYDSDLMLKGLAIIYNKNTAG